MLHESAQALVDEADLTCPYSKATRGNINVAICVTTTPVNLGTADKAA
jgi:organic hydroperoxide reductase OsmC/OhrA